MKFFYLFLFLITIGSLSAQQSNSLAQANSFAAQQGAVFEENKGQVWDTEGKTAIDVKYHFQGQGLDIFMKPTGLSYQFTKVHYPEGYEVASKEPLSKAAEAVQEALRSQIRTETYRMDMELVNANPNATIIADGKSKDYVQYYNRNALDVHSFKKLTYQGVYPGIDWVIYTTDKGLKYDFIVQPGANPQQIQLKYKHQEDLKINADGSFTLSNKMGSITEQAPISFQDNQEIKTAFKLKEAIISFDLTNYDPTQLLVIDPNLIWATYYGGNGASIGSSCTTDAIGNVYLAGSTASINNIASGGHQNTSGGGTDAFLVKFNSAGIRQWATYYGGSSREEEASCTTDAIGNVYLAGSTLSTNNIASGGHQDTSGGFYDAFLVKFNNAGVRQWASYYGGMYDDRGLDCTTDAIGNVYLTGEATSPNNIASGGHQNTHTTGGGSAFLVKFNNIGVRQWATYYRGSGSTYSFSCAIDLNDNIYIAGYTQSPNNIASGGHQNTLGGGRDAFLAKFNSAGVRQWATYYGGAQNDFGQCCTTDAVGNVYLVGGTQSSNNISSGGHQNTFGGNTDVFLTKFNSAGVRQWASYYGGNDYDWLYSCATDLNDNIYIAGYTQSLNNIASGGHQNTLGGGADAFLTKFNNAGVRQWASYYGGAQNDFGHSCATDLNDNIYIAGYTKSLNNIASGGHQNTLSSIYDAFLAKVQGVICTSSISMDVQIACDSFTWIDSNTYTTSNNMATFTLINAGGCDSVVTLNLTINTSSTGTDVQTACDSYTWIDGNVYTSSNNTAKDTLTNAAGCDSIITLNLTINTSSTRTDVQTACDTYTWIDGNVYTSSNNTATDTLTNAAGCDSIITLNLTINTSSTGTDVQTACDTYTWIDGNVYTLSNNTATDTLMNASGCDSVVMLNLTINTSSTGTDVQTACYTYTWIDGNVYTSSNNTATDTLTNAAGCDSIVTLNLTINTTDTMVIQNGLTLTGNQSGATYQWIDCDNGNTSIVGETAQSFTPIANGDYAVVITFNNCTDTSSCFNVVVNSIPVIIEDIDLRVYPNPTIGQVTVEFDEVIEKGIASLVDVNGRFLLQTNLNKQQTIQWNINKFPTGVYFLELQTSQGIYNYKIIKE